MATVKDQVKESLIGTTREPQLSFQTKATFDRHARRDEENGEPYMTVDDFVNAIAPKNEDYVSSIRESDYLLRADIDCHSSTRSNVNNMQSSFAWPIVDTLAEYL